MRQLTRWLRQITTALHISESERNMDDEMRFHLEMETAELQRTGVAPAEARRRALVAFGGVEHFKQEARDERRFSFAEHFVRDCRLAVRQLRRARGVALFSAALLAVGIGGTVVVFSVISALYIRPLPYPHADRLVRVQTAMNDATCGTRCARSPNRREVDAMVRHAKSVDAWGTIRISSVTLRSANGSMVLEGAAVSRDLVSMLQLQPLLGRGFTATDYVGDAPAVVVLSYSGWKHDFGGDSAIVGRPITLSDVSYVVVGVMNAEAELGPPLFTFNARRAQYLIPDRAPGLDVSYNSVIARLRNDRQLPAVRAELDKLIAAISNDGLISAGLDWRSNVTPIRETFIERYRASFWNLLGASAAVLLVTCLNVFGLYTARLHDRSPELATRVALGASGFRIAQQIAIEILVIAVAGGAGGILIGFMATPLMNLLPIDTLPFWTRLHVDMRGVALATLLTGTIGVLLGTAALIVIAPQQLLSAWRIGSAGGRYAGRMRQTLVASQIALTVTLLSVAGLLGKVVLQAELRDIGIAKHGMMYVSLQTPDSRGVEATLALNQRLSDRLMTIPGVIAAGIQGTEPVPVAPSTSVRQRRVARTTSDDMRGIFVEGDELATFNGTARPSNVSTQYFAAMGTPVLQGRAFGEMDHTGAPAVAIVDEPTAKKLVRSGTIIGKRIGIASPDGDRVWMTVVGVVSAVVGNPLKQDPTFAPRIYRPIAQVPSVPSSAVIRVSSSYPTDNAVRAAVREADAAVATASILSVEESLALRLTTARLNASLLVGCAIFATALCCLGIYAAVTFVVVSRRREIAIRLALGAVHGEVVQLFMMVAARMVGIGLLLGLMGAIVSTRFVKAMLYGADAISPAVLALALGVMLTSGVVAAWVPSRRASRLEPARLLRTS